MRDWKYTTNTENAVRHALMNLLSEKPLADITVSELAREAHVSRSTFYEHFGNVGDVFDSIVDEFSEGLSPLMGQVACTNEMKPHTTPFCVRIREEGPFSAAVGEDRFLSSFIEKAENLDSHDLFAIMTQAGYSREQARALCSFQMAGCFTAAQTSKASEGDWQDVKAVIDRFILGGIAACLAAKR